MTLLGRAPAKGGGRPGGGWRARCRCGSESIVAVADLRARVARGAGWTCRACRPFLHGPPNPKAARGARRSWGPQPKIPRPRIYRAGVELGDSTLLRPSPKVDSGGWVARCRRCRRTRIVNPSLLAARIATGHPGCCQRCAVPPPLCRSCGTEDPKRFRPGSGRSCMACTQALVRNGPCSCGRVRRIGVPCPCGAPVIAKRNRTPKPTPERRARRTVLIPGAVRGSWTLEREGRHGFWRARCPEGHLQLVRLQAGPRGRLLTHDPACVGCRRQARVLALGAR